MPVDRQLIAFLAAAAVLTVTPGADTMLVVRSVLARGPSSGVFATFGICSGLFVHAALSAIGVSAVLAHSAAAFTVLKAAGAAYLVYLGLRSLRASTPQAVSDRAELATAAIARGRRSSFREGLLSNLLNPKTVVFYLAFLPQFIGPHDPVLAKSMLLAAIHFAMAVIWLLIVVRFLRQVGLFIERPPVRRWLERVTGALLVGLGVRLALEQR